MVPYSSREDRDRLRDGARRDPSLSDLARRRAVSLAIPRGHPARGLARADLLRWRRRPGQLGPAAHGGARLSGRAATPGFRRAGKTNARWSALRRVLFDPPGNADRPPAAGARGRSLEEGGE